MINLISCHEASTKLSVTTIELTPTVPKMSYYSRTSSSIQKQNKPLHITCCLSNPYVSGKRNSLFISLEPCFQYRFLFDIQFNNVSCFRAHRVWLEFDYLVAEVLPSHTLNKWEWHFPNHTHLVCCLSELSLRNSSIPHCSIVVNGCLILFSSCFPCQIQFAGCKMIVQVWSTRFWCTSKTPLAVVTKASVSIPFGPSVMLPNTGLWAHNLCFLCWLRSSSTWIHKRLPLSPVAMSDKLFMCFFKNKVFFFVIVVWIKRCWRMSLWKQIQSIQK